MMFGGAMLLGWLLPVILLVLGGMWLFNNSAANRRNDAGPFSGRGQPTPEDILRQRYARGEISREEFEAMQETLRR